MLRTQTNNKDKVLKNFKVTKEENKKIQAMADRYAGGNFSEWVRYAAKHFKPSKNDLIQ